MNSLTQTEQNQWNDSKSIDIKSIDIKSIDIKSIDIKSIDIKSMTLPELQAFVMTLGEPAYRAKQLFDWMHGKLIASIDEMSNLSKAFREKLKEKACFTVLEAVQVFQSKIDGTCKYLFRIPEGNIEENSEESFGRNAEGNFEGNTEGNSEGNFEGHSEVNFTGNSEENSLGNSENKLKNNVIESVLMKYLYGNSVCISSQVGCRMGCKFCASTLGGLERNLSAAEMLEQIYRIQKLSGERVGNVVVMGTGEPMDNLDNLLRFLQLLSDENGLNLSKRNVTVSTCGLPDGIRALADAGADCTLALSLHAPNDELRKTLMPIANKVSIREALAATDYYFEKTGRRISFEYSLVNGVNDAKEHAEELAALLRGRNCHVNLIPVNPIAEREFRASTAPNVTQFLSVLDRLHINATVRRTLGADISASCGQLRKSYMETKK